MNLGWTPEDEGEEQQQRYTSEGQMASREHSQ